MANSFKTSSGNRSFGAFSEPNDAGDYISKKKARASFCVANNCVPAVKVGTQSNLLLFNKSNMLSVYPCKNSINKANLNINLITQLDLSGASIIKDFTTSMYSANINGINPNILPYLTYNVDPEGDLFANTRRNINNFVNYMVYSPPIMSQTQTQIQTQTQPYVINNGIFTISSTTGYNTLITFNYTNNLNSTITFNKNLQINAIVVGGGGGGGGSSVHGLQSGAGGGGGGQVLSSTINISTGSVYTIVIGSGGTGGTTGYNTGKNGNTGNNSFIVLNNNNIIITAKGGLGGIGSSSYSAVQNFFCDGGASGTESPGGKGGRFGFDTSGKNAPVGGGGGGGGCYYVGSGGNGSLNISIPIYGTTFGAGGGGGTWNGYVTGKGGNSNAGDGGGSYSSAAVSGKQNTGGGGGGGGSVAGGNGGSGVIILAFNV